MGTLGVACSVLLSELDTFVPAKAVARHLEATNPSVVVRTMKGASHAMFFMHGSGIEEFMLMFHKTEALYKRGLRGEGGEERGGRTKKRGGEEGARSKSKSKSKSKSIGPKVRSRAKAKKREVQVEGEGV